MSELIKSIFREYDIRGIFPDELNEDSIAKIAKAIAQKCHQESVAEVVIARDGRLSGPSLLESLQESLNMHGINTINIGLATSPLLYFAAKKQASKSGIMITGSHNPKNYNGIKLVIDDKPVDVIASVNGKITHGDRLRIKIPIVDDSWCDSGQLFTTFYTTINNPSIEELKGKTILGTARYKKVNPITEKINFRVAISIKSMLGDLVFLDMGTYDIDFLKRLKKMEQLTIELQDGVEIKVSDYFDIPKNTFVMDGVNNALDRARAECLKIVKENDIVKLGLKKINNEN